jgi:plasmid stabilization system protein ParE
MLVRFHDDADGEAQAAHDHYADGSPPRDAEFEAALARVTETIQRYPDSGHPFLRRTRRKLMHGFPYSVIYRILSDHVYIVAVAHFKQKWDYWLHRVDES